MKTRLLAALNRIGLLPPPMERSLPPSRQGGMVFTYWSDAIPAAERNRGVVADWRAHVSTFRVFGDADVRPLLAARGDGSVELYDRIRIAACRSDVARLFLLREHGGLYVDAHVGTADGFRLAEVLALLSRYELVLFDAPWARVQKEPDLGLFNGVMCARRQAPVLDLLIDSALANLQRQLEAEERTDGHAPYNIFSLTGAWDISVQLFDRGEHPDLKPEFADRVRLVRIGGDADLEPLPFHVHRHYHYRVPGEHWSERQARERLFDPAPPSARPGDAPPPMRAAG